MHPLSAYQPLEGFYSYHSHSHSGFRNLDSARSPPNLASNVRRCSISSEAPSRYHSTQSVNRGLQTPPPDMTLGHMGALHSHSHGQLRQLEPPVPGHGVPKSLDSCRTVTLPNYDYTRRKQSPPSTRRNSVAQIIEQYPEKQHRRKSTNNVGASMTVPSTINGNKANLAEFAAQVGSLWVSFGYIYLIAFRLHACFGLSRRACCKKLWNHWRTFPLKPPWLTMLFQVLAFENGLQQSYRPPRFPRTLYYSLCSLFIG